MVRLLFFLLALLIGGSASANNYVGGILARGDLQLAVPGSLVVNTNTTTPISGVLIADNYSTTTPTNTINISATHGAPSTPSYGPDTTANVNSDLTALTYGSPAIGGTDTITFQDTNSYGQKITKTVAVTIHFGPEWNDIVLALPGPQTITGTLFPLAGSTLTDAAATAAPAQDTMVITDCLAQPITVNSVSHTSPYSLTDTPANLQTALNSATVTQTGAQSAPCGGPNNDSITVQVTNVSGASVTQTATASFSGAAPVPGDITLTTPSGISVAPSSSGTPLGAFTLTDPWQQANAGPPTNATDSGTLTATAGTVTFNGTTAASVSMNNVSVTSLAAALNAATYNAPLAVGTYSVAVNISNSGGGTASGAIPVSVSSSIGTCYIGATSSGPLTVNVPPPTLTPGLDWGTTGLVDVGTYAPLTNCSLTVSNATIRDFQQGAILSVTGNNNNIEVGHHGSGSTYGHARVQVNGTGNYLGLGNSISTQAGSIDTTGEGNTINTWDTFATEHQTCTPSSFPTCGNKWVTQKRGGDWIWNSVPNVGIQGQPLRDTFDTAYTFGQFAYPPCGFGCSVPSAPSSVGTAVYGGTSGAVSGAAGQHSMDLTGNTGLGIGGNGPIVFFTDCTSGTNTLANFFSSPNVILPPQWLPVSATTTMTARSGSTITVASAAGVLPNMNIVDLTTPSNAQYATVVASVAGNNITLSGANAIAVLDTVAFYGTQVTAIGSRSIFVTNTTGLANGMYISDLSHPTAVPSGTQITTIIGSHIGLSNSETIALNDIVAFSTEPTLPAIEPSETPTGWNGALVPNDIVITQYGGGYNFTFGADGGYNWLYNAPVVYDPWCYSQGSACKITVTLAVVHGFVGNTGTGSNTYTSGPASLDSVNEDLVGKRYKYNGTYSGGVGSDTMTFTATNNGSPPGSATLIIPITVTQGPVCP